MPNVLMRPCECAILRFLQQTQISPLALGKKCCKTLILSHIQVVVLISFIIFLTSIFYSSVIIAASALGAEDVDTHSPFVRPTIAQIIRGSYHRKAFRFICAPQFKITPVFVSSPLLCLAGTTIGCFRKRIACQRRWC